MQVLTTDVVIYTDDASFDQRMTAFCCVRVNVSASVFPSAVRYGLVAALKFWSNTSIGRKFISDYAGLSIDFFPDRSF